jgi:sigma-B regulation protein RsbU (phosphoserine phosphatase)
MTISRPPELPQSTTSRPVTARDDSPRATAPGRRGASYRRILVLWFSLLVLAFGLALSALVFHGARSSTTPLAHALFQEVSDHAVTKTRDFLGRAEPVLRALGNLSGLGLATDDPDRLSRQLTAVLKANPGVSWVSFSDEAGSFVGAYRAPDGALRVNQSHIGPDGRTAMVEHEVLPDGAWRLFRKEADSGYDPRRRPFYQRAKAAGRLVWVPPYIFYEQSVPGITCANPLYDPSSGALRGVLTVDFDLNTLSTFVQKLSISPNSRLFVMSADGVLLAHPTERLAVRSGRRDRGELLKVHEVGDPLLQAFDAQLQPEDRRAFGGADRARQFEFRHNGVDYFARATAFAIDGQTTWIVGATAPQSDFLASARHSSLVSLAASLGAVLVAMAVAVLLARRVSGPILSLATFMRGVGSGDLSARADLRGSREFRELSDALNRMIADLRDRVRLRGAIAMATAVQQKLLPARPPQADGLDVFGFSAYCDETGGDYYDYLLLDGRGDGPALFVVGDVMGHGVGSALGMAAARAILRSRAASCGDLGHLLTALNDQLVPDMDGRSFITMLLWTIDADRRHVRWANAGHDPAIVYDPHADTFDEVGYDGIPLGIESTAQFAEQTFGPLRPGQVIVLGTDGVWDTVNPANDFYGKGRLRDLVRARATDSAELIATAIRQDLDAFRARAHQRDDVTLVVIKVLGDDSETSTPSHHQLIEDPALPLS